MPQPSSMPSNCQSAIVENSRHVNTIHSTVFISQPLREGGELRSPENIHHLKPANALVISGQTTSSVPPRVSSISQPVIVTSSPGLNSHPSHLNSSSNIISSVSESYSLQPKAMLSSNHPYERPSPTSISATHHVIKSPTNYSSSPHNSHQSQGLPLPTISARDQNPETIVYTSHYGSNQNRAVVTQQPSMYKASGTTTSVAISPPNSVLAITRQDASPHVHSQADQQPMDLGCRSSNSRIGVHHGRSGSPPPQHFQSQQQSGSHSHYGAINQPQQQSVVNYRRSPSPQAYHRVSHIQSVHPDQIQSARGVHLTPSPQGSVTQAQYGSSAFHHHLSPSKVCCRFTHSILQCHNS